MLRRIKAVKLALLIGSIATVSAAGEPSEPALEDQFREVVRPFLKDQCLTCHGSDRPKAKLDLSRYTSADDVVTSHRVWDLVRERLEAGEMPPEDAVRQPAPAERRAIAAWIAAVRDREARRNAGDPGPVLPRRLSNAEYDYTIRDLTGVDIRPTREFPIDPANESGFDNSGESLAMSPALLKKYLTAAQRVAEHLVLKPDGLAFAPHTVVTETDRDKFCVQRIVAFYHEHEVDYAHYFLACWRFLHRAALDRPRVTLESLASEAGLSARYLDTVWATLSEPWPEAGPLGQLQAEWHALPAPSRGEAEARRGCERMRDLVVRLRKTFEPTLGNLQVRGISPGSQPLVLWKNRQLAARRMRYSGDPQEHHLAEFCRVFPDAFFVAERAPYFDAKGAKSGRLLTAGFHLMQGYFRDDEPLQRLVIDEAGRQELDRLWLELDVITQAPIRQYKDFIFFEREEPPMFLQESTFDFARSEDKDAAAEAKIEQLRIAYLAKARKKGADDRALEAIETYFTEINTVIRHVEQVRKDAQPGHLEALLTFAERAYRRPLSQAERDETLRFYRRLREVEGLGHEDAIRDSITSILMSPHFCYRIDPAEPGEKAHSLPDHALASRLSYFVWSTMPDPELRAHAASGDLHDRDVLLAQTRRMLLDGRVRGLATEFLGNWLGFRRFEEHNSVDRERFSEFTNELREAMYEEPIRFFVDLVSRNGSVLDLIDADHTFANRVLARHYGVPDPAGGGDQWFRVDEAHRFGRGGLLPMSVFLTANSPGLRTSPVKRGYWVVRRVLGESIPAPPPEVPELPRDEAATGELTLPQLLARHRENKSCAGCHQRFDSVGLVFEGYDPIGRRRNRDLGGRPVDARATFPDGSQGTGLGGLRRYLAERRQDEFLDNFCRKLLAYALGRGLILSDEPLLRQMRQQLETSAYRFDSLIESIVTSRQFLERRGRDDLRQ